MLRKEFRAYNHEDRTEIFFSIHDIPKEIDLSDESRWIICLKTGVTDFHQQDLYEEDYVIGERGIRGRIHYAKFYAKFVIRLENKSELELNGPNIRQFKFRKYGFRKIRKSRKRLYH